MKKTLVSMIFAATAFAALPAAAQTFPYGYGYSYPINFSQYQTLQTSGGPCTTLSSDLSYGSRGSTVSSLQSFLVTQNIPGGGSWMVTGYYGRATYAAVRAFQQMQNLPVTGVADAATRAAITRMTCLNGQGGYTYPQPSYPTYPSYPYTNPYNYNNNYNNCYPYNGYPCNWGVEITSLSMYSGAPGQSVTVYGRGFDTYNNNVNFGGHTLTNLSSPDGTTLTFIVPQYQTNTTAQISVVSSRGRSNPVTFTVSANSGCNGYNGYNSNCCYPYNNGYNYGYGYNNNCCNGYGYGYNANCYAPTVGSINGPTSLTTGGQGTWTVVVNNPNATYATVSVNWGDSGYYGYNGVNAPQTTNTQGSQTLSFTHTYYTAGTYTVTFTVTNGSGQSNTATATVNVGGGGYYGGNVSLNSIAPNSGTVGTQVMLYGSGFTPNDNVVHFGIGGLRYVSSSNNGSTISFTVPYYVSACDLTGTACGAPTQSVTPGTYPIYVTNGNGTSQTISFYVNY